MDCAGYKVDLVCNTIERTISSRGAELLKWLVHLPQGRTLLAQELADLCLHQVQPVVDPVLYSIPAVILREATVDVQAFLSEILQLLLSTDTLGRA